MKKRMALLLAAALCLALAGCSCEHAWKEATCTTPRTCTKCEVTEGEALGHQWQEANCQDPEICTRCGEEQGEALGHDWQEADCTTPKTCARCDVTEGEALGHTPEGATFQLGGTCSACGQAVGPLTPGFEEHQVPGKFVEVGKEYDYVTTCYTGSEKTTGKLTVTDYKTTAAKQKGYEWKKVTMTVTFNEEIIKEYGIAIECGAENYYDIEGHDASYKYGKENEDGTFTVNWNGEDFAECQRQHKITSKVGTDPIVTFDITYEFLVPEGYDGMIVSFLDVAKERGEGVYIYDVADENTLHFRLN